MGFKHLQVNARLTRPTYGDSRKAMEINIEDQRSGLTLMTLQLDADQFMDFMSNHSGQNIACILNVNDNIGKVRKHRKMLEPFNLYDVPWDKRDQTIAEFFEAVEAKYPDWSIDKEFNSKRYDHKNKTYEVGMVKYEFPVVVTDDRSFE